MTINILTPRHNPGYLLISASSGSEGHTQSVTLRRHITQDRWTQAPHPESGDWEAISEPSWVARCLLATVDKGLLSLIQKTLQRVAPDDDQGLQRLYVDLIEQSGGPSAWALVLCLAHQRYFARTTQNLLDDACARFPSDAPDLKGWCNHAALLGGTCSAPGYPPAPDRHARLLRRMQRLLTPRQLGRTLADLQALHDPGPALRDAILQSGLSTWYWEGVPAAQGPVLFTDLGNAVEWLCESVMPDGAPIRSLDSPRRRLRSLRDAVRERQLRLVNTRLDQEASPLHLLQMIDDQATPAGAGRLSTL